MDSLFAVCPILRMIILRVQNRLCCEEGRGRGRGRREKGEGGRERGKNK